MKTFSLAALLLAQAPAVYAAHIPVHQEPDLIVFEQSGVDHHDVVVGAAEQIAQKMLADVGIEVEWRHGTPDYHGLAKVIELYLSDPDLQYKPGAMAYARLGKQSATRMEVFYNRVRDSVNEATQPALLAHVFVHEITHILEGVDRHSAYGVMKAAWGTEDRWRMRYQSLPFAPEDLRLLHAWTARHRVLDFNIFVQFDDDGNSMTTIDTVH
jgi:hypothetical protein